MGGEDHALYPPQTREKDKLAFYDGHLPVAELDTTFHAIANAARMERWSPDPIHPLFDAGKLQMLLFQFSPRFDCRQKHVKYTY
ncbi:DUF72 domain-containing protein [Thermoactinomyces mirandus]|uniref:DUF72 domain-containing protein n=1 Tax=Thermoactinomyces mirandus TaxID=2756294 RepID=A0A7W1XV07_9BACL|nr:DUF72 domain-containing protein [Thermoactinomyces mirandus]MBA4603761.1 DUF72 domain-containing protein [Thermoactinomyces mirandus]